MAKKLDQVLVIDVESTCWEGPAPVGQESEIIDIGLCIVDIATAQRLEKRRILVKPERSRVSEYCTTLTRLSQNDVDCGASYFGACALLEKEYFARERVWASFGDYDRRQFERQCRARNIRYPFGPTHLNVKNLFAIAY